MRNLSLAAHQIRDRLIPHKILTYLLFARPEWLVVEEENVVRLRTGDAARAFRIRNSRLHEALDWLENQRLVRGVTREATGEVVIELRPPSNLSGRG